LAKQTITQRSFMLGEPREEFLEADDLEVRMASCREARNVRIKATRTIDQKLGSRFKEVLASDAPHYEVRPVPEELYLVRIESGSVTVLDADLATVFTDTVTLGDPDLVWVQGFRKKVIIGCPTGMWTLTYGTPWTMTAFAFSDAPGGETAQPYWSFETGITMQPSALTGSITLTASAAFFTSAYVGIKVRYATREILITAYTSPTQVTGTVVNRLPPTYRITLGSTSDFRVGDVVVGNDTDFKGQIVAIAGSQIDVVTLEFLDGPDVGEDLSTSSASSAVSAKTTVTPAATNIWDEPLISPVRGYPGSASGANGRLALCDFAEAQDVVVLSSTRDVTDFLVGDADDDAIARACGNNSPRFLHVVDAGDLILLSDTGIYVVELQGNAVLSPSTFVTKFVDGRGASAVNPVRVDDGVVFVEASGLSLAVVQLSGNIYLKWSVRTITNFHSHLIKSPVALSGPPLVSSLPEKYLMAVNADGTMAVMSWVDGFDAENIGFVQWETDGDYKRVFPAFGSYWAVTQRSVGGSNEYLLEQFTDAVLVDCAVPLDDGFEAEFEGQSLHVCGDGWYSGTATVTAGLEIEGSFPDGAVAGWNYTSSIMPWPQEQIQHPKAGILAARVIRVGVSVLHTGPLSIRCNSITQNFGGYSFGDDLSATVNRTKMYKTSVIGRRDHPEIEIIKAFPGTFQILAVTQEVVT